MTLFPISYWLTLMVCVAVSSFHMVTSHYSFWHNDDTVEADRLFAQLEPYNSNPTDLVFLRDSSCSIGYIRYMAITRNIKHFATQLNISETRIHPAVVTYSNKGKINRDIDYITNFRGKNKCTFREDLDSCTYIGHGKHTPSALLEASEILKNSPRDAQRLIIILTDGKNGIYQRETEMAVDEMSAVGIDIIAIGIGYYDATRLRSTYGKANVYFGKDIIESIRRLSIKTKDDHTSMEVSTKCGMTCDDPRTCACGTRTGRYRCVCKSGSYGESFQCKARYFYYWLYHSYNYWYGSPCTACPENSETAGIGSTSIDQCQCKPGYEMVEQQCNACPRDYYNDKYGSSCTACPENSQTISTRSTSSEQCLCKPGYGMEDQQCVACPLNTYKDGLESSGCVPCPDFSETANVGSTSIEQCECIAGYAFVDQQCENAPPSITCPQDLSKTSLVLPVDVTWDDPVYDDDNDGTDLTIDQTHVPGSSFDAGSYNVTYTVTDKGGKSASCTFMVIVNGYRCAVEAIPENGAVVCTTWDLGIGCGSLNLTGYQICLATCREGYDFELTTFSLYRCTNKKGAWTIEPCHEGMTFGVNDFPDCVDVPDADTVKGHVEFQYYTDECTSEEGESEIRQNLINFLSTIGDTFPENEYCTTPECDASLLDFYCGPTSSSKRSPSGTLRFTIVITVHQPQLDAGMTIFEYLDHSITEVIAVTNAFITNAITVLETTTPVVTIDASCKDRLTSVNDKCLMCGAGSYYSKDGGQCMKCIKGFFQHEMASTSCLQCPGGSTTHGAGATSLAFCIVDTKKWRDDGRCGPMYPLSDGSPSECDPNGSDPCCSAGNWCGNTVNHCDCNMCIDYRDN